MADINEIFSYSLFTPKFSQIVEDDPSLLYLVTKIGELSYKIYNDPFVFLVNTIIGQMLSAKAADVISLRMLKLCDDNVCPSILSKLQVSSLRGIGISAAKSQYILELAGYFLHNPEYLVPLESLEDNDVIAVLTRLRGIGSWTAKMYLIFVLNRKDVLPYEDGAFRQSYRWLYPKEPFPNGSFIGKCIAWKPYSSIVSRYLYLALDSGLTQTPIP